MWSATPSCSDARLAVTIAASSTSSASVRTGVSPSCTIASSAPFRVASAITCNRHRRPGSRAMGLRYILASSRHQPTRVPSWRFAPHHAPAPIAKAGGRGSPPALAERRRSRRDLGDEDGPRNAQQLEDDAVAVGGVGPGAVVEAHERDPSA